MGLGIELRNLFYFFCGGGGVLTMLCGCRFSNAANSVTGITLIRTIQWMWDFVSHTGEWHHSADPNAPEMKRFGVSRPTGTVNLAASLETWTPVLVPCLPMWFQFSKPADPPAHPESGRKTSNKSPLECAWQSSSRAGLKDISQNQTSVKHLTVFFMQEDCGRRYRMSLRFVERTPRTNIFCSDQEWDRLGTWCGSVLLAFVLWQRLPEFEKGKARGLVVPRQWNEGSRTEQNFKTSCDTKPTVRESRQIWESGFWHERTFRCCHERLTKMQVYCARKWIRTSFLWTSIVPN